MKILPTVGPATESDINIEYLKKKYQILRLNGSHNTLAWHENISKKIKKNKSKTKILLDVPGIKPRTDNKKNIFISNNQEVVFTSGFGSNYNIDKLIIKLTNPIPRIDLNSKYISISDGEFNFKILKIKKNSLLTKSLQAFTLKPSKGVNFINSIYNDKLQTKKYISFIKKAKKRVLFDSVGLSFIQGENVIENIKKIIPDKTIVAKIENYQGILNIEKISEAADCLMIDRGDLAAEIGVENLYKSILKIIHYAKKYGKPIILATDNLNSMNFRSNPTQSEVFALGFAKNSNIDFIMLSDETATYTSWKKTLKWIDSFLKHKYTKKPSYNHGYELLWTFVKEINHVPLVIFTKKGLSIPKSISLNTNLKMIVFTESNYVNTLCSYYSNVESIKVSDFPKNNFNNFIDNIINQNLNLIFKNTLEAFLLHITNPKSHSRVNTLRLIKKSDFM